MPRCTPSISTRGFFTEIPCMMHQRLLSAVGRFALPPQCACCSAPLDTAMDGDPMLACEVCLADLCPSLQYQCQRCSAKVGPNLDTASGCQVCRDEKYAFTEVVSLGAYADFLRMAVLRTKRNGGEALAGMLARLLLHRHRERLSGWQADLIVPVPHHWIDRFLRQHFPPATMADVLARSLNVPVERNILLKRRWTRPQTRLSATDRRRNLQDAFRVSRDVDLSGAVVLLVDDVLTTGTTADRASRALREAGAAEVRVVVAARASQIESALPS